VGIEIPVINVDMSLKQGLLEMTKKGLGMTAITDSQNHLLGVFTDVIYVVR